MRGRCRSGWLVGAGQRVLVDAGLYLRTDFWVRIISGGSYGHTCYVAKELAAVTRTFACLLPQRYELLDTFGVRQVIMDAPQHFVNEDAMVTASDHFYPIVKTACQLLQPRISTSDSVSATGSRRS